MDVAEAGKNYKSESDQKDVCSQSRFCFGFQKFSLCVFIISSRCFALIPNLFFLFFYLRLFLHPSFFFLFIFIELCLFKIYIGSNFHISPFPDFSTDLASDLFLSAFSLSLLDQSLFWCRSSTIISDNSNNKREKNCYSFTYERTLNFYPPPIPLLFTFAN